MEILNPWKLLQIFNNSFIEILANTNISLLIIKIDLL